LEGSISPSTTLQDLEKVRDKVLTTNMDDCAISPDFVTRMMKLMHIRDEDLGNLENDDMEDDEDEDLGEEENDENQDEEGDNNEDGEEEPESIASR